MTELTEETGKEIVWALRSLTDAINDYAKIKERGIRLAERIEAERPRISVYE